MGRIVGTATQYGPRTLPAALRISIWKREGEDSYRNACLAIVSR